MIPQNHPNHAAAIDQIIEEGDEIASFLSSPAWPILERTIQAQIANYKQDCFDAAKDTQKNLANFLGRMEALEWLLTVISRDFLAARAGAIAEKQASREREAEEASLEERIRLDTQGPMRHNPGTI